MKQLESLGILSWFDAILSGPGLTKEKWQTKVNLIQDHLPKESFERDFFIGDTETDVLAAQKLGMTSIAVSFGIRTPEILKALNPTFLLDLPNQLNQFLRKTFL